MTTADIALVVAAGLGAGVVNGAAGGGTLVSFPALLAVGLPALRANITSTVGILPCYVGGVAGFRAEVSAQRDQVTRLSVPAIVGAAGGSVLLLTTPTSTFAAITPYLVLAASALFGIQPLVKKFAARHSGAGQQVSLVEMSRWRRAGAHLGVLLASVYGGYFGAGLGVVLLAILGIMLPDDLVATNGLRSILSLLSNIVAAFIFVVHGAVAWVDVAYLAPSSLVGGYLGARMARRLPPLVFRVAVIALGLATAIKLFVG